jgi:hypothetical protein
VSCGRRDRHGQIAQSRDDGKKRIGQGAREQQANQDEQEFRHVEFMIASGDCGTLENSCLSSK